MSINRRDFLKTMGVAGLSLVAGDLIADTSEEREVEFYGILYDATRCVGCQTCETVCAEVNNLAEPEGYPDPEVVRKTDDKHRTVVNAINTESGEIYYKSQCMHCNEPACVAACLTKAMYKTKEGPVIWREEKCMGCRYCMLSCPFDVPKFEYNSSNPKIVKCTMCYERISEGGIPACAENCPAEAITFGKRRDLIKEAHKRISENPDMYFNGIYGSETAGGTSFLYLSPVPFEELGMKTDIQNESYPALTKGFLFAVPKVFVLLPPVLLAIYEATKKNKLNEKENG